VALAPIKRAKGRRVSWVLGRGRYMVWGAEIFLALAV
jgi:hypothetical protein